MVIIPKLSIIICGEERSGFYNPRIKNNGLFSGFAEMLLSKIVV